MIATTLGLAPQYTPNTFLSRLRLASSQNPALSLAFTSSPLSRRSFNRLSLLDIHRSTQGVADTPQTLRIPVIDTPAQIVRPVSFSRSTLFWSPVALDFSPYVLDICKLSC